MRKERVRGRERDREGEKWEREREVGEYMDREMREKDDNDDGEGGVKERGGQRIRERERLWSAN